MITAIVLACVCLVPEGLEERRAREDKFSAAADAGARWLRTQAVHEARALGASHAWAGEYDYYDGGGTGDAALALAPSAGFVFESAGCGDELEDRNVGAVTEEGGRLRLHPVYVESQPYDTTMPSELVGIRWGARRYLVPPEELPDFCNTANAGGEPYALRRRGDGAASGRPHTSDGPLGCILDHPRVTRIATVGGSWMASGVGHGHPALTTAVTLPVGRTQGIFEGMRFILLASGQFGTAEVVVTKVNEDSCDAEVEVFGPPGARRRPGRGWPMTSRRVAPGRDAPSNAAAGEALP